MGRVLYRVYSHQLKTEISKLQGKEVDIVLVDNSVLHGLVFSFSENELILKNIVRNKSTILFKQIKEILFV